MLLGGAQHAVGDVLFDTRENDGAGVGVALLFGVNGSVVLNITVW